MSDTMEQEPNYKQLYEMAKLQIANLERQVSHWEMKARILRQMAEQQEALATAVEIKVELLKSGAIDLKKLGLR